MIDIKIMGFTRQEVEEDVCLIFEIISGRVISEESDLHLVFLMLNDKRSYNEFKDALFSKYYICFELDKLPAHIHRSFTVKDLINLICSELNIREDLIEEKVEIIDKKTFWDNIDLY